MKKKIPTSSLLFIFTGIIAVAIVGLAIKNASAPAGAEELAQCLTENSTKMYGAWWCPHCEAQKELFGKAFKQIDYIECSPGGTRTMSQECQDAGIEGYPTWEFADGSRVSGEQSFQDLSEKSGCQLPATE